MNVEIFHQRYGKSSIRLTKVRRLPARHELVEMNVDVSLYGSFERSYTDGDNTDVIATDSMKNTVYLLAKDHPLDSPESFALHLAKHFVQAYSQVGEANVRIKQSVWHRIEVNGAEHPTAFRFGGTESRHSEATFAINRPFIEGGLNELMLLKTTDSAFTGFVRDEFTTLPETTDRILATQVKARWKYADPSVDFNPAFERIRSTMLAVFANHRSKAVQQTLYEMGTAALAAEPGIENIHLEMPNKHRVPFNFKPFGKEFENDIYITTDEPSGEIVAYLQRGDK